jgi:integrase
MSYTIRPYRRGGWEVDIVITYPNGEKHRERRKAPVDSKLAAKRWARERELHLLQHGRPPRRGEDIDTPPEEVPTIPTLAEFVPRYLEYVKANRQKPSTRKAKQTICRCHLIPVFGHLRLHEIGPADVERLKARHANHSAKTLNNALSTFNSVLTCAVALGVLDEAPVRARWVKTTLPSMPFYDFEEFDRLCVSARRLSEQHELIVLLGGCAGLRCGEIRALRWSSIDFTRGLLTVERAYSLDEVLTPKGDKIRTVPMTKRLQAALQTARASREPENVHVLTIGGKDQPPSYFTVRKWVNRAMAKAGLPVAGPHSLRHTFCSHLAMTGAHVMEIKLLAGHSELETTQRYMHLSPRALRGAMDRLDRLDGVGDRARGDGAETRIPASPIS